MTTLGIGVVVSLLLYGTRADQIATADGAAPGPRVRPTAPTDDVLGRPERSAAPIPQDGSSDVPSATSSPPDARTFVVTGRIVDRPSGRGVPDLLVVLDPGEVPRHRETGALLEASGRSDSDGTFRISLPTPPWKESSYANLAAWAGDSRVLFTWIPLGPDLLLYVDEPITLHGQVVDDRDLPIAEADVWLAIPIAGLPGGLHGLGTTRTGNDGRFTLRRRISRQLLGDAIVARIGTTDGAQTVVRCTTEEALGPAGARIALRAVPFTIRVIDEHEQPISGASIRVGRKVPDAGRILARKQSDASGRATFRLPSGALEVGVTRDPYPPAIAAHVLEAGANSLTVVLAKSDRIRVHGVVTQDAALLPDVWLSAIPRCDNPDVAVGFGCHAQSDVHGRFELDVPRSFFPVALSAYSDTHGHAGPYVLADASEAAVEIVYPTHGSLELRLEGWTRGLPFESGFAEVFLRGDGFHRTLRFETLPITIPGLPTGPVEIAIALPGKTWAGQGTAVIQAGAGSSCTVWMVQAPKLAGRVVDGRGHPVSGAKVELLLPGWFGTGPEWTRAIAGADGTFTVHGVRYDDHDPTLEVSHPAFAPARLSAHWDQPISVTLDGQR